MNDIERSIVQDAHAQHEWNFKGGKEKARNRCLELIKVEAIKRGLDLDKLETIEE